MRGSCLCGAVQYQIDGPARPIVACHCSQCRKTSGHYVAATQASNDDLTINGQSNLTWFASSDSAKRGFCNTCGSQLFWSQNGSPKTSIMAGSIDGASGLSIDHQLFPEAKGDYYLLPSVAHCVPTKV